MSKVTWSAFLDLCKAKKPSQFKPPDWDEVCTELSSMLCVENDSVLRGALVPLRERYFKETKSKQLKHSAERDTQDNEVPVLKSVDLNPCSSQPVEQKKRKTKSLDQLSEKQIYRRINELWKDVEKFASDNNESTLRIVSLLLSRCGDRQGKEFYEQVWSGTPKDKKVSNDSALAILNDCDLGRETYGRLRKILKKEGHDILPPWINLREKQTAISREVHQMHPPHIGVHLPFTKSMQLTASRIMEGTPVNELPSSVVLEIKYGCDGSGSHAIPPTQQRQNQ